MSAQTPEAEYPLVGDRDWAEPLQNWVLGQIEAAIDDLPPIVPPVSGSETVSLIPVLGQSNAWGQNNDWSTSTDPIDPNVFMWGANPNETARYHQVTPASVPTNGPLNTAATNPSAPPGVTFARSFSSLMAAATGRRIVILPLAVPSAGPRNNGTTSARWRSPSLTAAYNPSTNSPALADGTASGDNIYRASVAGTRNFGSGSTTFAAGDFVIYRLVSGQGRWVKAVNLPELAVAEINLAVATIPGAKVAAILWHQGEADSQDDTDLGRPLTQSEYAAEWDSLHDYVNANAATASQAPWIVGGLAPERVNAVSPKADGVMAALRATPSRMLRTAFAEAPVNVVQSDNTHFTALGQRQFGIRYWEGFSRAVRNLLGLAAPKMSIASTSSTFSSATLSWPAPAGRVQTIRLRSKRASAATVEQSFGPTTTTATISAVNGEQVNFELAAVNEFGASDPVTASLTVTATNPGPLATSATLWKGYGLRRLRTGYTGSAVTVRRSSDNATLDVGFDSNGLLDVTALLAWVGTSDAFVTRWWDQSANAWHMEQATAALQPALVIGGQIVTNAKGIPGLRGTGTEHLTDTTAGHFGMQAAGQGSLFGIVEVRGAATVQSIFSEGRSSSSTGYYVMAARAADSNLSQILSNASDGSLAIDVTNTAPPPAFDLGRVHQIAVVDTGSEWRKAVDGTFIPAITYTRTALTVNRSAIMARSRNSFDQPFIGVLSELALYTSAVSNADRDAVIANQKGYALL